MATNLLIQGGRMRIHYAIHSLTGAADSCSGCEIISTRVGPGWARACRNTLSSCSGSSTFQGLDPEGRSDGGMVGSIEIDIVEPFAKSGILSGFDPPVAGVGKDD